MTERTQGYSMGQLLRFIVARASVLCVLSVSSAAPLHAQVPRPGFAVLPFENAGSYGQDKEIFEALALGIPATIAAALSTHPGTRVAEADRVTEALAAQKLRPAQRIDAATAGQIAKAAGARYTITGSFSDFYGKVRINARLVDAESGQIVKVVSNDDPKLQDRSRLSAIIQGVSEKLAAASGLPPLSGDAASGIGAIPTDALNQYSRGLLYESRGDKAKASDSFQRAIAAYPDYQQAKDGLQRVQGG
jgi:TolB-like protein